MKRSSENHSTDQPSTEANHQDKKVKPSNMSDLIHLNVGGVLYPTTRHTLTSYPDSMLGSMFSDRMPTTVDENGRPFIDRDGGMFRYILNFLRTRSLSLPDNFQELDILSSEADFYQIQPLIEELKYLKEDQTGGVLDITEYVPVTKNPLYKGHCTIVCSRYVINRLPIAKYSIWANNQNLRCYQLPDRHPTFLQMLDDGHSLIKVDNCPSSLRALLAEALHGRKCRLLSSSSATNVSDDGGNSIVYRDMWFVNFSAIKNEIPMSMDDFVNM